MRFTRLPNPILLFMAFWYLTCGVAVAALHSRRTAPHRIATKKLRKQLIRSETAANVPPKSKATERKKLAPKTARLRWDQDSMAVPPSGAFRELFRMRATAYMPRRSEGGRMTFTERDGRREHGVAVDPHIIPLGTKLWIPGYGKAIADDVGSAIQGHHIDLRMQAQEQETAWGVRQLRVYVLQYPD